jgi:hypothetical protein
MKLTQILLAALSAHFVAAQTTNKDSFLEAPSANTAAEIECAYRRDCLPDVAEPDAEGQTYPSINSVGDAKVHITRPPHNKGMFWSGVPYEVSRQTASAHGLFTLEMSVPNWILHHPNQRRGNPNRALFWDRFSQAFSEILAEDHHTQVAVSLSAASFYVNEIQPDPYSDGRMVHRSDWSEIEYPIMRRHNIKVIAYHPLELGENAGIPYELWPEDHGRNWQIAHGRGHEITSHTCPGLHGVFSYRCVNRLNLGAFKQHCATNPAVFTYRVKLREDQEAGGQCVMDVRGVQNEGNALSFLIDNLRTTNGVKLEVRCVTGATTCPA